MLFLFAKSPLHAYSAHKIRSWCSCSWYLVKHSFSPNLTSLVPQLAEARVTIHNLHPQGSICKTSGEYLIQAVGLVRLVATDRINTWYIGFFAKLVPYISPLPEHIFNCGSFKHVLLSLHLTPCEQGHLAHRYGSSSSPAEQSFLPSQTCSNIINHCKIYLKAFL